MRGKPAEGLLLLVLLLGVFAVMATLAGSALAPWLESVRGLFG